MSKNLTFVRFNSYPVKVRISMVETKLNELGYVCNTNGKRDRQYIEALKKFQSDNGLSPNAVVCIKTFETLKLK